MSKSITFHFDNPESLNEDGTLNEVTATENVNYVRYAYASGFLHNSGFSTSLKETSFTIDIPFDKEQAVSFDVDQTGKGTKLIRFEFESSELPNYRPLADVFSANGYGNQLSPVYFLLIVDGENYDKVTLTTKNV